MNHQRWREIVDGRRRGLRPAASRALLRALSGAYGLGAAVRNGYFDLVPRAVHRLPVPVISVGNLVVGGTGKTPMACWLAARLHAMDRRVAVLLRGYKGGGHGALSDEAAMLRSDLGERAVVLTGADRVATGRQAIERHGVQAIILDDGFQHRRLGRDLDILLFDATCPPQRLHLLPRGVLREPLSQTARADLIVLTRCEQVRPDVIRHWHERIKRWSAAPIYQATTVVDRLLDDRGRLTQPVNGPVLAFCGIGNPEAFQATLRAFGIVPVACRHFDDHHRYTEQDLDSLDQAARSAGAAAMVTTEKDWTRLEPLRRGRRPPVPIYRLRVSITLGHGETDFCNRVQAVLQ